MHVVGLLLLAIISSVGAEGVRRRTNLIKHVETDDKKEVSIFWVPHQDDEVISYGVAIVNSLFEGHDVHLVLYTDGRPSDWAYNNFNRDLEKHGFGRMTKSQMIKVRNTEFYRSAMSLGVPEENIHIDPVRRETKDDVKNLILKYEEEYNHPWHKGMSYKDHAQHHSISGAALAELSREGLIAKDPRYYIRLVQMDETFPEILKYERAKVIDGEYETYKPEYKPFIEEAADHYIVRDSEKTEKFRDGIGFAIQSVGTIRFEEIKKRPRSKFHT